MGHFTDTILSILEVKLSSCGRVSNLIPIALSTGFDDHSLFSQFIYNFPRFLSTFPFIHLFFHEMMFEVCSSSLKTHGAQDAEGTSYSKTRK